mmetsp:Transcript_61847/g.110142  ORF Transcript_61847/g.110142 Transcript_61847/m.110142 type:complete len:447 (-) Transcript_61847:615-1955(-)
MHAGSPCPAPLSGFCRSVGTPYHGTDVYFVQWIPRSGNRLTAFLLSASEDTTVSLVEYNFGTQQALRTHTLHGGHSSSVRALAVLQPGPSDSAVLVFSAGGQEELSVWAVQLDTLTSSLLSSCSLSRQYLHLFHPGAPRAPVNDNCSTALLPTESPPTAGQSQGRSWQVQQQKEKVRLHYRVLCMAVVQGHSNSEGCFLVLGCSDSLLKIVRYDYSSAEYVPVARSAPASSGPILALAVHKVGDQVLAFAGTTTANIFCWDLTECLMQDDVRRQHKRNQEGLVFDLPQVNPYLTDLPSHQSGVNGIALYENPGPVGTLLLASVGDDQSVRATALRVSGCHLSVLTTVLLEGTNSAGLRSVQCDDLYIYTAASDQRLTLYRWVFEAQSNSLSLQWHRTFVAHVQAVASTSVFSAADGEVRYAAVAGHGLEVLHVESGPSSSVVGGVG